MHTRADAASTTTNITRDSTPTTAALLYNTQHKLSFVFLRTSRSSLLIIPPISALFGFRAAFFSNVVFKSFVDDNSESHASHFRGCLQCDDTYT